MDSFQRDGAGGSEAGKWGRVSTGLYHAAGNPSKTGYICASWLFFTNAKPLTARSKAKALPGGNTGFGCNRNPLPDRPSGGFPYTCLPCAWACWRSRADFSCLTGCAVLPPGTKRCNYTGHRAHQPQSAPEAYRSG